MQKINCRLCEHFFVTWKPAQPYGCKAYGFKSKMIPSMVVKQSSGQACIYYTPKFPK